jgi:hypothetical protein
VDGSFFKVVLQWGDVTFKAVYLDFDDIFVLIYEGGLLKK